MRNTLVVLLVLAITLLSVPVQAGNLGDLFDRLLNERINTGVNPTEPVQPSSQSMGVVTASVLNFRSDIWGSIQGKLPNGTQLEILGKKNGWYQVKAANGQTGWVSGRYVRKTSNTSSTSTDNDTVTTNTDTGTTSTGSTVPGGEVARGTGRSLRVQTTGYYPPPAGGYRSKAEERMEGGALDCRGNRLRTLQDYTPGSYVSCATDPRVIRTGTYFTLDDYPGIRFLACDVGGAIKGNHIDICVKDRASSYRVTGSSIVRYL